MRLRGRAAVVALGVAAAGLVVAGLVVVGPPAAEAALPDPAIVLNGAVTTDAPCVVGPGPDAVELPIAGDASGSWSDTRHIAAADPARRGDAQAGISAAVTSVWADGSLGSIHVAVAGAATVSNATDPACHSRVQATGQVSVRFHVAQAGWVTTTRRVSAGQAAAAQPGTVAYGAVVDDLDAPTVADLWVQQSAQPQLSTGTSRRFLTPGDYAFLLLAGVRAGDSSATPASSTLDATFDVTLAPAGQRSTPQRGSRVVALPGSRDCGRHTVDLGFTRRVRKARKVVVRVNGTRAVTWRRPKAGALAVPLLDAASVDLKVVITWKKRRHHRPVSATGSYLPCLPEVG